MREHRPELDKESAQRHSMAPNAFYDLIVFLTPTMTFLVGAAAGLHHWISQRMGQADMAIDTPLLILLGLSLFFGSYELGRIAETFSDTFVAGPIKWLHRRRILFTNSDYNVELSDQVAMIGIPEAYFFGRTKSKWTLFFFALEYVPHVGADLLKRYAWEKLARSSAFAILCLCLISITVSIFYAVRDVRAIAGTFGSPEYTWTAIALFVFWSVDYYKRNCWNNDLLITTMPVIISAVKTIPPTAVAELQSAPHASDAVAQTTPSA